MQNVLFLTGKGLQQTFWLVGKTECDTIRPQNIERRNGIYPQLYEAPDLAQMNSKLNDEIDNISQVRNNQQYVKCHQAF